MCPEEPTAVFNLYWPGGSVLRHCSLGLRAACSEAEALTISPPIRVDRMDDSSDTQSANPPRTRPPLPAENMMVTDTYRREDEVWFIVTSMSTPLVEFHVREDVIEPVEG